LLLLRFLLFCHRALVRGEDSLKGRRRTLGGAKPDRRGEMP
jgi:hypothetical protein